MGTKYTWEQGNMETCHANVAQTHWFDSFGSYHPVNAYKSMPEFEPGKS